VAAAVSALSKKRLEFFDPMAEVGYDQANRRAGIVSGDLMLPLTGG
jgi:hypothetical protein